VGPLQNPIEMGFTHEGVVKRLGEIPVYKKQFEAIFGELTIDRVGQAIAAFERVLVTGAVRPTTSTSKLRSFAGLDEDDIAEDADLARKYAAAKEAVAQYPMSDAAKRGREIFTEKGNCTACPRRGQSGG